MKLNLSIIVVLGVVLGLFTPLGILSTVLLLGIGSAIGVTTYALNSSERASIGRH